MIITRHTFSLKSSIGSLEDDAFSCYTLEDVARASGVKIMHETAIPEGLYKCKLTFSPRFKRILPLIYNLPNLTVSDGRGQVWKGIRIHNGVHHLHSSGCILVGYEMGLDRLAVPAGNDLTTYIQNRYGVEEFDLTIVNKQK